MLLRLSLVPFLLASAAPAADLTGNWVVENPGADGVNRKTYFDLKQDGARITGHIRVTQFYYSIKESTGGADGFTITGSMMDAGHRERTVKYEGKLDGDTLRIGTRRRPDQPLTEMTAHRTESGEGAYPARLPLPALHKVPDNGLARTPPMGWNSWNKFAGRVDDPSVRGMADAMVSSGMRDAGYIYINIDDTWEGDARRAGQHHHQQEVPRHEGAGRLCARQGPEARHLLVARAQHLRGLRRHLRARRAGRAHLGRLGHRLSEVRLVRRPQPLYRRGNAGRLPEDGRRAAQGRASDRLQPVPVRLRRRVEVGRGSGRQPVAHHRRHPRHLRFHGHHRFRAGRASRPSPGPATGTIRTCSRSATAA